MAPKTCCPEFEDLRTRLAPFRGFVFWGLLALWFALTTPHQKVRSIFVASTFSVLEFLFTGITEALERNTLWHDPIRSVLSGYTTIDMWVCNVFFEPLGTELFFHLLPSAPLRVLLGPLVIWLGESLMGYTLLLFWGRRAWHYTDRWARLHGNITLRYWPLWMVLHVLHEVAMAGLFQPTSELVVDVFLQPVLTPVYGVWSAAAGLSVLVT